MGGTLEAPVWRCAQVAVLCAWLAGPALRVVVRRGADLPALASEQVSLHSKPICVPNSQLIFNSDHYAANANARGSLTLIFTPDIQTFS